MKYFRFEEIEERILKAIRKGTARLITNEIGGGVFLYRGKLTSFQPGRVTMANTQRQPFPQIKIGNPWTDYLPEMAYTFPERDMFEQDGFCQGFTFTVPFLGKGTIFLK